MRRVLMLLCLALAGALVPAVSAAAPLDVLGNFDPGSPGFNASAVGLDGIAYLGSWGGAAQCPSLGVRVIDVHDPSAPRQIATAATYSGTTAEHLAVASFATPSFVGNVLFVGVQRCAAGGGAASGLAIWDVTDAANPTELAFVSTGRAGRGVHEFTVGQRGDRWYAYLAVPNSELTTNSEGDLRILDVSDPRQPVEVANWGARRDAGLGIGSGGACAPACRGSIAQAFLHSVALSPNGRIAYLSYWDLGVIVLDVSEPSAPTWLGQFSEPAAAEGNTHSVALAHSGTLAVVADETAGPPWGRVRMVDVQDPSNPIQVGVFETPNSAAGTPGEQYAYSVHNPLADDRDPNRVYLAWYADGLRVLDVSDAARPVEVSTWLPPREPMVWNVALMGNLILLGDINHGLYILER